MTYVPSTARRAAAAIWLADGTALHDKIGEGYTLLRLAGNDSNSAAGAVLRRIWRRSMFSDQRGAAARTYGYDLLCCVGPARGLARQQPTGEARSWRRWRRGTNLIAPRPNPLGLAVLEFTKPERCHSHRTMGCGFAEVSMHLKVIPTTPGRPVRRFAVAQEGTLKKIKGRNDHDRSSRVSAFLLR